MCSVKPEVYVEDLSVLQSASIFWLFFGTKLILIDNLYCQPLHFSWSLVPVLVLFFWSCFQLSSFSLKQFWSNSMFAKLTKFNCITFWNFVFCLTMNYSVHYFWIEITFSSSQFYLEIQLFQCQITLKYFASKIFVSKWLFHSS